jgi:Ni,Fe-hydrogenase III large subunit
VQFDANSAFESIESAQEYLGLLAQVVTEAQQAIQADIHGSAESERPRRVEALRLIGYNLEKLESHLKTSRRILNDLRMLRRILQQRESAE